MQERVILETMSIMNQSVGFASWVWRALRLQNTPIARQVDKLSHLPLPFGLSYPYGKLYGWNVHQFRHNQEQETIAFFSKHIKQGDKVADIGANIGYYTLQFSKLVGENGKVVAFEPSPFAYANLKKAVREKNNIALVQKGVFSEAKILTLYSKWKGDGMASVMYEAGGIETQVPLMPLRDYPENFDWAKIDVEGAELEVLKGMSKPIKCTLEVAGGILNEHGGGIEKYFSDIEALGYRIYFIVAGGETIEWTGDNLDALESNIYIEPR